MTENPDVRSLVHRAKTGDRVAFDQLVRCHQPALESFVRSRLGAKLAARVEFQDIVQESLLRAFRSFPDFEFQKESALVNWLCGIAKHVIFETASSAGRDKAVPLEFDYGGDDPSPSQAVRRDERFDRLQQALDSLRPEYRQVILLVRVEGLPVREVAERLGRTPHAISNLLLRATHTLRCVLGDTESLTLPDRRLRDDGEAGDA